MIFSSIVILLVLIVAYFHYNEGMFSATISAVLAILAAVFALSYHETVVAALLRGRYPDYASAGVLVVLFAVLYTVPRVVFDRFIPGNLRLPSTLDKVGGAAMGVVAGVFAVGVLAVAAQALPFGPSIMGYSRFTVAERTGIDVPQVNAQTLRTSIPDELKVDDLDPALANGLILPVDDVVVSTAARLSDGGSLAGPNNLTLTQPNYLGTLFGQRLGIQVGANRAALNVGGITHVTVPPDGVAAYRRLPQVQGEFAPIRPPLEPKEATLIPADSEVLLAVRARIAKEATDTDGLFRFSLAAVRLAAGGENYRPIGTLQSAAVLVRNRLDDPLFAQIAGEDAPIDFVFRVPAGAVLVAPAAPTKVSDGVFLEVKRFARVDLSGQPVAARLSPAPDANVMRKTQVQEYLTAAGAAPAVPATPAVP